MGSATVIKTLLKNQRLSDEDERGARHWRSAELVGDDWFLAEHCVEGPDGLVVRQWISFSIHECVALLRSELAQWSRLLAYVRVPFSAGSGYVFGEILEVHESRVNGARLLRFTNGMTILRAGRRGTNRTAAAPADELELVFAAVPRPYGAQVNSASGTER